MNPISHLLILARCYGEATGVSVTTVSWRAFADSKRVRALEAGRTITIRRAEKVIAWFSANWPPGAEWPTDVPRPAPTEEQAA